MSTQRTKSVVFSVSVMAGFCAAMLWGFGIQPFEVLNQIDFKAHEIIVMESQFANLQKRYFELQHEYFDLEKRHNELMALVESRDEANKNLKLTGAKDGRSNASIVYEVPANLTAEKKYYLAFSHMNESRFAEAAKTFDSFLWDPEGAAYQNSNSFYEAGVAWYKVNNFKKSHECFLQAKARAEGVEKPEMLRKIELWMMVLGQHHSNGSKEE